MSGTWQETQENQKGVFCVKTRRRDRNSISGITTPVQRRQNYVGRTYSEAARQKTLQGVEKVDDFESECDDNRQVDSVQLVWSTLHGALIPM